MEAFPLAPVAMARGLWHRRNLIKQMTVREVLGRYRGSFAGLLWAVLMPLLMLAVYAFFFSFVFKVRWGADTGSPFESALIIYAGLIVHGLFSECASRAPNLILQNANFVKKVVFPLEILPVANLGGALFHAMISTAVLLVFALVGEGHLPWTVVLVPFVFLPVALCSLGISWALAAIGVYIRDVGQFIGFITLALMFLSPVFYPASAIPAGYRYLLYVNPLTYSIEHLRDVAIYGRLPPTDEYLIGIAASVIVAWIGLAAFQKMRRGFADVI